MGGDDSLVDTTTSCCGHAGGGSDLLAGCAGNDTVSADDLISDVVDGGAGFDRARIDVGLDRIERVEDTRRGF
jgi:hypothetical protein